MKATGGVQRMRRLCAMTISTVAMLSLAIMAPGTMAQLPDDFYGTYKLLKTERKVLDTGEIETIPGENGFITYGRDGRMLVLITRGQRPKPESVAKLTDQDRIDLFRTMTAYGGSYKFVGDSIEHQIDISWNEVWTGTMQIRDVKMEGDRLMISTRPGPSGRDGRASVTVLVWEKVK